MQVWVIDTSSIIWLRQIPRAHRHVVASNLDQMVHDDLLFFPPQVLEEVQRHEEKSDFAHTWAKRNAAKATRHGRHYDGARTVLQKIPNLIDPDKVSNVDQADPYVIALALHMFGDDKTVRIITDDYRTTPKKTSLSAAAGVFGVPALPIRLFLTTHSSLAAILNGII